MLLIFILFFSSNTDLLKIYSIATIVSILFQCLLMALLEFMFLLLACRPLIIGAGNYVILVRVGLCVGVFVGLSGRIRGCGGRIVGFFCLVFGYGLISTSQQ